MHRHHTLLVARVWPAWVNNRTMIQGLGLFCLGLSMSWNFHVLGRQRVSTQ
jgi:hypothetical protein